MIFVTYSFIPPCICYSLKSAMEIVINMFNADISSSVMGKFSLKYHKLLKKKKPSMSAGTFLKPWCALCRWKNSLQKYLKFNNRCKFPLALWRVAGSQILTKKLFYSEPSKRKEIIFSSWLSILCTLLFGYARKWFYEEFSTNTVESVIIFSSALKFVFPINIK